MKRKMLFDTVAEQYNTSRPIYVKELFEDIIEFSGINANSKILEIGPGTGQATEPFLKTGAKVVCVEPGPNLTAICRQKFSNYENFSIINCSFEDFESDKDHFDLIYAGTSFHWIDYDFGMKKAFDLLKNERMIALFWNRPMVNDPDNPLHTAIQDVYKQVFGSSEHAAHEELMKKFNVIDQAIETTGFNEVQCTVYKTERYMSAEEYTGLLATYSDNIALDEDTRSRLFNGISNQIIKHGNEIRIRDWIDVHFGKKY